MSAATTAGFATLFQGRSDAFGTGEGRVIRTDLTLGEYEDHLRGEGPGLGVFPLGDDGKVSFAAVDLDEPDFQTARQIQQLLPGTTWIERSRSGNAHVWVFFNAPVEAYIPRGVMKAVLRAIDRERVEVFPKQDGLLPGMVGNYINLPYFGDTRPVLCNNTAAMAGRCEQHYAGPGAAAIGPCDAELPADEFVRLAISKRNDPADWQLRAEYLGVVRPGDRTTSDHEFGTSANLHECALHILEGARSGERPVREGHRSVVYFNLAKQLLDWEQMDEEQAWELVEEVNQLSSPDSLPRRELRRIFSNAASGRWTSTGCDDPLMAPYVSPTCPIAGR